MTRHGTDKGSRGEGSGRERLGKGNTEVRAGKTGADGYSADAGSVKEDCKRSECVRPGACCLRVRESNPIHIGRIGVRISGSSFAFPISPSVSPVSHFVFTLSFFVSPASLVTWAGSRRARGSAAAACAAAPPRCSRAAGSTCPGIGRNERERERVRVSE